MGLKGFLFTKSYLAQIIFFVILLYSVSAIIVLLLALGIVPNVTELHLNPHVLILFSVISFGLTTIISSYHLSTVIRRRKRKTDRV